MLLIEKTMKSMGRNLILLGILAGTAMSVIDIKGRAQRMNEVLAKKKARSQIRELDPSEIEIEGTAKQVIAELRNRSKPHRKQEVILESTRGEKYRATRIGSYIQVEKNTWRLINSKTKAGNTPTKWIDCKPKKLGKNVRVDVQVPFEATIMEHKRKAKVISAYTADIAGLTVGGQARLKDHTFCIGGRARFTNSERVKVVTAQYVIATKNGKYILNKGDQVILLIQKNRSDDRVTIGAPDGHKYKIPRPDWYQSGRFRRIDNSEGFEILGVADSKINIQGHNIREGELIPLYPRNPVLPTEGLEIVTIGDKTVTLRNANKKKSGKIVTVDKNKLLPITFPVNYKNAHVENKNGKRVLVTGNYKAKFMVTAEDLKTHFKISTMVRLERIKTLMNSVKTRRVLTCAVRDLAKGKITKGTVISFQSVSGIHITVKTQDGQMHAVTMEKAHSKNYKILKSGRELICALGDLAKGTFVSFEAASTNGNVMTVRTQDGETHKIAKTVWAKCKPLYELTCDVDYAKGKVARGTVVFFKSESKNHITVKTQAGKTHKIAKADWNTNCKILESRRISICDIRNFEKGTIAKGTIVCFKSESKNHKVIIVRTQDGDIHKIAKADWNNKCKPVTIQSISCGWKSISKFDKIRPAPLTSKPEHWKIETGIKVRLRNLTSKIAEKRSLNGKTGLVLGRDPARLNQTGNIWLVEVEGETKPLSIPEKNLDPLWIKKSNCDPASFKRYLMNIASKVEIRSTQTKTVDKVEGDKIYLMDGTRVHRDYTKIKARYMMVQELSALGKSFRATRKEQRRAILREIRVNTKKLKSGYKGNAIVKKDGRNVRKTVVLKRGTQVVVQGYAVSRGDKVTLVNLPPGLAGYDYTKNIGTVGEETCKPGSTRDEDYGKYRYVQFRNKGETYTLTCHIKTLLPVTPQGKSDGDIERVCVASIREGNTMRAHRFNIRGACLEDVEKDEEDDFDSRFGCGTKVIITTFKTGDFVSLREGKELCPNAKELNANSQNGWEVMEVKKGWLRLNVKLPNQKKNRYPQWWFKLSKMPTPNGSRSMSLPTRSVTQTRARSRSVGADVQRKKTVTITKQMGVKNLWEVQYDQTTTVQWHEADMQWTVENLPPIVNDGDYPQLIFGRYLRLIGQFGKLPNGSWERNEQVQNFKGWAHKKGEGHRLKRLKDYQYRYFMLGQKATLNGIKAVLDYYTGEPGREKTKKGKKQNIEKKGTITITGSDIGRETVKRNMWSGKRHYVHIHVKPQDESLKGRVYHLEFPKTEEGLKKRDELYNALIAKWSGGIPNENLKMS